MSIRCRFIDIDNFLICPIAMHIILTICRQLNSNKCYWHWYFRIIGLRSACWQDEEDISLFKAV